MSTERDTHFKGFATLLWDELEHNWNRDAVDIIAERAYDLAFHTILCTTESDLYRLKAGEEKVEKIVPDLDEWPEIPDYDW